MFVFPNYLFLFYRCCILDSKACFALQFLYTVSLFTMEYIRVLVVLRAKKQTDVCSIIVLFVRSSFFDSTFNAQTRFRPVIASVCLQILIENKAHSVRITQRNRNKWPSNTDILSSCVCG